jgi:N-acetylmuramoyl-L-alanine amidase
LRDPAYQKLVAGAIMAGLKKYFYRSPPPGTLIAARVEHDRARG